MRRIPNFVLLRAFEATARLKSFTRAAEELHLTQSAISHQVRELEEHVGRRLLTRRHRAVETTPEGARLQHNLARVFDVIEAACDEVSLAPAAQVLALHSAPSFAAKWLGPRLPQFMRDHPDITIRLSSGAEPIDLRRDREIDVAISYGRAIEAPELVTLAMGEERIAPMCSPSLLAPGAEPRELIRRLTLIDSQLSRIGWADWFAGNGLVLPSRARPSFDRAALALSAAVDGLGVALETTRLAERELSRGDLVVLGEDSFVPLHRATHFLSYREDERDTDKVRRFVDWLLDAARLATS
ncbi:LysR substrate-binding domain-containing protein [Burkholderia gladioli]|uniref:Bacterial regulatory helix-turn-helix, lysR family protein n=1 Tax=Burkholderia gladioli TaxID=28095 RepID=A0AAW3F7C4_BURGA|nr:LysR substrate-binding domain-containing protein [Burkholderia gladioli]AJW97363.1 bacterial regulatory helix-turn-helix, lysR family protein [Burkholderia gladioli]ASD81056.1 LysR family transcriptional regulator [Burkholderia gladioli pv. gladioli]AWY53712.1 LysR family transcriptional regulator [Burkholderia gladioli pv. gladioli]KAF1063403.1 HTH-type transcriptional regulator PerR [Burkholderia gladioli]KGC17178.1 bacterial regulatory helix-turn-helix, lysR family protein [Burkholderia 